MTIKINDIELAISFVSSGGSGGNIAMFCRKTGQIGWSSEEAGIDDIPEEAYDSDDWIAIPDTNDLDLGRNLVFRFIALHLPSEEDRVHDIFRRRGAYRQYKDFLEAKGMLQKWYDYEEEQRLKAINEWCEENDIPLTS